MAVSKFEIYDNGVPIKVAPPRQWGDLNDEELLSLKISMMSPTTWSFECHGKEPFIYHTKEALFLPAERRLDGYIRGRMTPSEFRRLYVGEWPNE